MEKRKLVKSGASSFIIALPVDWVRRNKLDKGDEVSLEENEKGNLIIEAKRDLFTLPSYYTIKIDESNRHLLKWELLKAYLHNYTIVNIESKNISAVSQLVLNELRDLIGLDIIEQTKEAIVLKNFSSNDSETSPYFLLKKIDVGVRAMFEMVDGFFSKGFYEEDVLELKSQHEYNERVYVFAIKLVNGALNTPSLMRTYKTDYRQLMKEYAIVNCLKQISFHFNRIGKLLLYVEKKDSPLIKEIFDNLSKKYRIIIGLPKSSSSKDLLQSLKESQDLERKWELTMKGVKNPVLMEIASFGITINNLIDQLAIEIMS